jgi:recombination protein RecT
MRNPTLLQCDPATVVRAVAMAAEMGLEPGSALNEAYLVPFKNTKVSPARMECQLIPGYQGLVALCWRSGFVESIDSAVVYTFDEFEFNRGEGKLTHIPNMDVVPPRRFWPAGENDDPDPDRYSMVKCVYAVARLKGGQRAIEVLPRWKVEELRSRSRASGSGPWVTDWEAMAKKTAIKQLVKMLPKSVELSRSLGQAMAADNAVETGDPAEILGQFETLDELEGDAPESSPTKGVDAAKQAINDAASIDVAALEKHFKLDSTQTLELEGKCKAKGQSYGEFLLDAKNAGAKGFTDLLRRAAALGEPAQEPLV